MTIIGHGVDLVEVDRIRAALERHGDRFANRIFTQGEQSQAGNGPLRVQFFAGRFAAKEAVMKALGVGWGRYAGWLDIEVVRAPGRRPELVLAGSAARRAATMGITRLHLALTHTAETALAHVIAEA